MQKASGSVEKIWGASGLHTGTEKSSNYRVNQKSLQT